MLRHYVDACSHASCRLAAGACWKSAFTGSAIDKGSESRIEFNHERRRRPLGADRVGANRERAHSASTPLTERISVRPEPATLRPKVLVHLEWEGTPDGLAQRARNQRVTAPAPARVCSRVAGDPTPDPDHANCTRACAHSPTLKCPIPAD